MPGPSMSRLLITFAVVILAPCADGEAQAGGSIGGTVRSQAGGTPLAGVPVSVSDGTTTVWAGATGANGEYLTASSLPSGTYYVRAQNTPGHLGQIFNGINCDWQSCPPYSAGTGTPVIVTQSRTTTGIDFSLLPGGVVTGTVTAAGDGAPIRHASVSVTNAAGAGWWGQTDVNGNYATDDVPLPSGTYFVTVGNVDPFLGQLYRGMDCGLTCPATTTGTPVSVTAGTTTAAVDFALVRGGVVRGRVTSAAGGLPIEGATVFVSTADYAIWSGQTDATGVYATTRALPSGIYYANAMAAERFLGQVYDGVNCATYWCSPSERWSSATPFTVTQESTTSGIDFSLLGGGVIRGTVTSAASGEPIQGVRVMVANAGGNVWSGETDASGVYATKIALASDAYQVVADGAPGFLGQVYAGVSCGAEWCSQPYPAGSPVSVMQGATTSGIDLALVRGGVITGIVTAAAGGAPLAGAEVVVFDPSGSVVGTGRTDANGAYTTTRALPSGTYFVLAHGLDTYLGQAYGGTNCSGRWCEPADARGAPVNVTESMTTSGISFSLVHGGVITGTVTAATGGQPLAGARVRVTNASGFWWPGETDSNGVYATTTPLATGTYFVTVEAVGNYLGQVYSGITCGLTCPPATTGTPVAVTAAATTSGIDFTLARGGAITGTVTDSFDGAPLANVGLDLASAGGDYLGWIPTTANGVYQTTQPLASGTCFIRTSPVPGYVGQLYSDMPCSNCDPTSGTPIVVTAPATTAGINFRLARVPPAFTDASLVPGVTRVRAVHITELRGAVAALRARQGLAPVVWTDASLEVHETRIRSAHLVELRAALEAVYQAAGRPPPTWAPTVVVPGATVISAAQITELRAAVAAIW